MTADAAALLAATRAERAALADDLAGLPDDRWTAPSLCTRWSVEDTVAHLTAAAGTGPWRWMRSVLGARFDFDLHNDRRLAEHRGATPAETLERFRAVVVMVMTGRTAHLDDLEGDGVGTLRERLTSG